MLGVHKEGARTANDKQAHVRAGKDLCKVLDSIGNKVQGLLSPAAHGINNGVKTLELLAGKRQRVALEEVLRLRAVSAASDGGDVKSATHRFRNNKAAHATVCCDDGDLLGDVLAHGGSLLNWRRPGAAALLTLATLRGTVHIGK